MSYAGVIGFSPFFTVLKDIGTLLEPYSGMMDEFSEYITWVWNLQKRIAMGEEGSY